MPQLNIGLTNEEFQEYKIKFPEIIITDENEISRIMEMPNYESRYYGDWRPSEGDEFFFIDRYKLEEYNKNHLKDFQTESKVPNLRLLVSRTWGNRTYPINSKEWREMRERVLIDSNFECRFCGLRSKKYMICDHIDGDASNNDIDNLGINCPICDLIRHSGRAGVKGKIKLKISSLSQIDIVKKTQQYFEKNGVVPPLNEIDKDIREIPKSVKFNLMIYNYSELDDVAKSIRGFFTPEAANEFEKVIGIRD